MAEELTVPEAAEALGVTRARVDQFIRAGRLPVSRTLAGRRLVRKIDVMRLKRMPSGWQKGRKRKAE
jgi:excisionase family DNA binding protein